MSGHGVVHLSFVFVDPIMHVETTWGGGGGTIFFNDGGGGSGGTCPPSRFLRPCPLTHSSYLRQCLE